MGTGGVLPGPNDTRERDLLGRLGLDERATTEDIARTRDELQSFLATAPKSVRGWARAQATAADEAFALLSDPIAWRDPGALPASRARSAAQLGGPATPPVRRATQAADPAAMLPSASEGDEDDTFDAMLAELTPSMHRDRFASPAAPRAAAAVFSGAAAQPRRFPKVLAIAAGLVVVAAVVVVGIYQFAAPAATAGFDEARVAELMGVIQQNPKDTAALLELGDLFFQAGDYTSAATWLDKVVVLEPNNVRALLAVGAAQFNLGDVTSAKTNWEVVLKLDAENVEAHYDLGYLYLNQAPPDIASMQREWNEVIRLAPGTDIAKFVQQHFDALAGTSPAPASGAPATSPAPSAGTTAAPTTAPSAGPSESVEPSESPKP